VPTNRDDDQAKAAHSQKTRSPAWLQTHAAPDWFEGSMPLISRYYAIFLRPRQLPRPPISIAAGWPQKTKAVQHFKDLTRQFSGSQGDRTPGNTTHGLMPREVVGPGAIHDDTHVFCLSLIEHVQGQPNQT
jgi:hypothetical protein